MQKKSKVYSPDALSKTTELLDLNPEFYTIWNYRRHILLHLFETTWVKGGCSRSILRLSDAEGVVKLLSGELRLTIAYLQVHPKVYWIWNHRKWCLENVPQGPKDTEEWRNEFWKTELIVIEKMLDADARNCTRLHEGIQTWLQAHADQKSTRGIIVDTSSPHSPHHSPLNAPHKTNCGTHRRRSRATSPTFLHGIVGRRSWAACGRACRRKAWTRRKTRSLILSLRLSGPTLVIRAGGCTTDGSLGRVGIITEEVRLRADRFSAK